MPLFQSFKTGPENDASGWDGEPPSAARAQRALTLSLVLFEQIHLLTSPDGFTRMLCRLVVLLPVVY